MMSLAKLEDKATKGHLESRKKYGRGDQDNLGQTDRFVQYSSKQSGNQKDMRLPVKMLQSPLERDGS